MNLSNLLYASAQVFHNFGACMVVGGSVYFLYASLYLKNKQGRQLIAFILAGWIIQALSGVSFGLISYLKEGSLPDIGKIARAALILKIACTVLGFFLTALLLKSNTFFRQKIIAICAIVSMTAAAFLRWYS